MYNTAYGMVKTITDGIKDAHMQYEMAVEAWEEKNHDCARLHAEEAENRIQGVKRWWERLRNTPAEHEDPVRIALLDGYKHWLESVERKLMEFRSHM